MPFSPSTVTPGQNSSAASTLTITTTSASSAAFQLLWRDRFTVALMSPLLGLVLAGFVRRSVTKKILLLAVMTAGLIVFQACGGNPKSSPTMPPTSVTTAATPAGTYTVTISAVSSGTSAITHSQVFTPQVQ